jgi:hypothetical protein
MVALMNFTILKNVPILGFCLCEIKWVFGAIFPERRSYYVLVVSTVILKFGIIMLMWKVNIGLILSRVTT